MAKDTRPPYPDLLGRIHDHVRPSTYVEIGVATGRSLARALPGTDAVGIDPSPIEPLRPIRCSLKLFKLTSDEFFERHDLRAELDGRPVELAFIDGMHLFEFALRDFMSVERFCDRDSVVLVHDCIPLDAVTASRERTTEIWTGDVWKLVVCLREYRPDLTVSVLDTRPSGIALITGLDPSSPLLPERYDEICARFVGLGYDWIADRKQELLAPIADDWETVRSLLPPRRHG